MSRDKNSHREKVHKVGAADPKDPGHAKYIRYLPSTERLLRQFLKSEVGLGKNAAYERGHVFTFEWCSEDPQLAQPEKVATVQKLMEGGLSFEEAFDAVAGC